MRDYNTLNRPQNAGLPVSEPSGLPPPLFFPLEGRSVSRIPPKSSIAHSAFNLKVMYKQQRENELKAEKLAYHLLITSSLAKRSDEELMLETSALYSLRWPIYIFNLPVVDITKLPCYPHRRSTTISLETFTLFNAAEDVFKTALLMWDTVNRHNYWQLPSSSQWYLC